MKFRTSLVAVVFSLAVASFGSCAKDEMKNEPKELQQAADVISYILRPMNFSRSAFKVVHPEGKPSQFVEFMFSTMGTAERPYSEEDVEANPGMRDEATSVRMPLIPKGVALVPNRVDSAKGKQLVLRGDDARWVLIVEGYLDPNSPPQLRREWPFPKLDK